MIPGPHELVLGLRPCNAMVGPCEGLVTCMADGSTSMVTGIVKLPFTIGGQTKTLKALIVPGLREGYNLGADFVLLSDARLNARERTIAIENSAEIIRACEAGTSEDGHPTLASIGLQDLHEVPTRMLEELLEKLIPKYERPLGFTNLVSFDLELGTCRQIKQKYYPVLKHLEEIMHAHVREKLQDNIIEPSDRDKVSAYPLPFMDTILSNASTRSLHLYDKLEQRLSPDKN